MHANIVKTNKSWRWQISIDMDGQHRNNICSCSGQQCSSNRLGAFWRSKIVFVLWLTVFSSQPYTEAWVHFLFSTLNSPELPPISVVDIEPEKSVYSKIEMVGVVSCCLHSKHSYGKCEKLVWLKETRGKEREMFPYALGESANWGQADKFCINFFQKAVPSRLQLPHLILPPKLTIPLHASNCFTPHLRELHILQKSHFYLDYNTEIRVSSWKEEVLQSQCSRNPIWQVSIAHCSIYQSSWNKEVSHLKVLQVHFLHEFKICKWTSIFLHDIHLFFAYRSKTPMGTSPASEIANEFNQCLLWTTVIV